MATNPNLAMIPSGYKATKLYSVLPTDGTGDFTVTRAGKKNRINSELNLEIVDANVPALNYDAIGGCPVLNTEPQSTNLITYPISYGNSYWTKSGATIEGDPSTAGSELITNVNDRDFSSSTIGNWTLNANGTGTTFAASAFDGKTSSLITAGTSTTYAHTILSTSFTSGFVDGNTYRIKALVYVPSANTNESIYIGVRNIDGGDRIQRPVITDSWSEIDYTFTVGADVIGDIHIGFLSATTNGDKCYITDVSVKEVVGYSAPSVDFPTSAFKLVEDTGTGNHRIYSDNCAVGVGGAFSTTIYVKNNGRNWFQIRDDIDVGHVYFDVANGVIGSTQGGAIGTIDLMSDGWYKCTFSFVNAGDGNDRFQFFLSDADGSVSYTGDGTSGVYIFNAQLETGSAATSPTFTDTTLAAEGSTSTRLADAVTGAGDVNTFNSSEGVLFIETSKPDNGLNGMISIWDGTSSNYVEIEFSSATDKVNGLIVGGGINSYPQYNSPTPLNEMNKIAIRWNSTSFSLWFNGIKVVEDLTGIPIISGINELQFKHVTTPFNFFGNTKQLQVLPYQTDTQMATLTTL